MTASVAASPRPRRGARRGLVAVALLAILQSGCATLDEQQRRWIFQPGTRTWAGAGAAEGMQEVWIEFNLDTAVGRALAELFGLSAPGR